jgi:hypothetical protein
MCVGGGGRSVGGGRNVGKVRKIRSWTRKKR